MTRSLGLCIIVLMCSVRAIAIDAVALHTVFYSHDPANQARLLPGIDLCWQINPNTLHYTTTPEKKIIARIRTDIVFSNDAGVIKEDHFVLQTVPRNSIDELAQFSIIDKRSYTLAAGLIKIKFVLTDLADSTNRLVLRDSFTVPPPPENKTFYSGIQLLDTIYESKEQTAFSKHGRQQVPSSTNFINDGANTLSYYAELYQAGSVPLTSFPLIQKVSVSKNEQEGFYGSLQKTDTITKAAPVMQAYGSFPIASLPSGNYYLRMTLETYDHTPLTSATYFFQRMNKHPVTPEVAGRAEPLADTGVESVTVLNLSKTFLVKYNMAQIRAILKMLLPFSDLQGTRTINNFLKKPDEIYMRYYIYNFFSAINKQNPAKAWKDFTAKITDVNKRYNSQGTPGYETERGFLYLKYGPPSEIITVGNEPGTQPYEIWQYNTLKQTNGKDIPNAIFLFYRPNQMINDYRLLHSTVAGEVQNTSWRSLLYLNAGTGDNMNYRVEQYFGTR